MNAHVLNKFGFKKIALKEQENEVQTPKLVDNMFVSIIKPQDHANPQIVFKIPRDVLSQMKWEITDRVSLHANPVKNTVALVRTTKKDKDSFAISTQGASISVARETKRGGVVKVGWREELCQEISGKGTFQTTMEMFGDALIVKLPQAIFA